LFEEVDELPPPFPDAFGCDGEALGPVLFATVEGAGERRVGVGETWLVGGAARNAAGPLAEAKKGRTKMAAPSRPAPPYLAQDCLRARPSHRPNAPITTKLRSMNHQMPFIAN
jgi:hypothetical protein